MSDTTVTTAQMIQLLEKTRDEIPVASIRQNCHPTAGMELFIDVKERTLIATCKKCEKRLVSIRIA